MFILDKTSFSAPLGINKAKILSIIPFLTETSGFLKIFKPQKVKNIVTSFPLAFAPFAIIKEARALSRSFEKTTIVCPLNAPVFLCGTEFPFCMVAIIFLFSSTRLISLFEVFLHQASISDLKPLSVDITSAISPSESSFITSETFIMGPGHCMPDASILSAARAFVSLLFTAYTFCLVCAAAFFLNSLYSSIPPASEYTLLKPFWASILEAI